MARTHRVAAERATNAPQPNNSASVGAMHAARNTQQALDWASKRRLQVERASRLRTERQALLKADRVNADDFDFADEEPPETARQVGAPIAGRRAQHGPDDGSGRGASQPAGDMLPSAAGGHGDYQRFFSDPPPGQSGRRSVGVEGAADGDSQPRPEWAREMSAGLRPSRFADGADGGGYDQTGHARLSIDPTAPSDPPSAGRSSRRAGQPDSWDWFRDDTHAAPVAHAERRGSAVRGGNGSTASDKHEAAVAAAAARFPDDLPLTQSDGAIGFARQRNLPRGAMREAPPPLTQVRGGGWRNVDVQGPCPYPFAALEPDLQSRLPSYTSPLFPCAVPFPALLLPRYPTDPFFLPAFPNP
jgi:hypothetical protein